MKKSLLALVALGAFAGAAQAQSSVTLYGIIDEGLLFNNNAGGKHLYSMASGVMQGSRFGLRGTEDLGGGLKAIFVLENGFNSGNGTLGQGGAIFGRQAYVGLSQSQYGTVTFGRPIAFGGRPPGRAGCPTGPPGGRAGTPPTRGGGARQTLLLMVVRLTLMLL